MLGCDLRTTFKDIVVVGNESIVLTNGARKTVLNTLCRYPLSKEPVIISNSSTKGWGVSSGVPFFFG